jgi:CHAT domain-containing protein
MTQLKHRCLVFAVAALNFESRLVLAQQGSDTVFAQQAGDASVLRELVEQFFTAYAGKDLDGLSRLWSTHAPGLLARKQVTQDLFAIHQEITISKQTFDKVSISADRANLRVNFEMSAVETKTGKQSTRFGRMTRVFHTVRDEGVWKIWRELSAEEELAEALVEAKSDAERAALLAADTELLTPRLRNSLTAQAFRLFMKGEYPRSLSLIRLIETLAEQTGDKGGNAISMIDSAVLYFLLGDFPKAMEYYKKVPPLDEIEHDQVATAHVLSRRGLLHYASDSAVIGPFRRNSYAQALEDCQRSLTLSDATEDKAEIAFTLNTIGMIYSEEMKHAQALEFYQKSLKVCESLEEKMWTALPLNGMGRTYHLQDNDELALKYYHQSLALSQESGIKSLTHYILTNIGEAYDALGNYAKALEYFQQNLSLLEELGNKALLSLTLRDVGGIHRMQGNYPQALEYYRKALAIEQELGNNARIAGILTNIGYVYHSLQNFGAALESVQRSLELWEALGDKEGIYYAASELTRIHRHQNNFDLALEYLQECLTASEALDESGKLARTLADFGLTYRELGKYDRSLDYLQRALSLAEAVGDKTAIAIGLLHLGEFYHFQGNYDRALRYYDNFLEVIETIPNKIPFVYFRSLIAATHYSRGDYTKTLELSESGAATAKQLGSLTMLWHARTMSGKAYLALNQPDRARLAFDEAITAIETLRTQIIGAEHEQQRFFEDKLAPYHEIVKLLVAQGKIGEAFTYAERSKARVLLDALQRGDLKISRAMNPQEEKEEQRLKNQIVSFNAQVFGESLRPHPDQDRLAELKTQLQKARQDYEAFRVRLYVAHPELRVQRGEARSISLDEAAHVLSDASTAILEYVLTDDKTFLFLLAKKVDGSRSSMSLRVFDLPVTRSELASRVEAFRRQLGALDMGFRGTAAQLYDVLLRPARPELEDKTKLVVVPDGVLWDLPFQALESGDNRFLLQDHSISYAPSLTVLAQMVKSRRTEPIRRPLHNSLLAMGNPALGKESAAHVRLLHRNEKLEPLPEAETEVKNLGRLYGPKSRIYVGNEAQENRFKAESDKYKILHLATHAILNNTSPMYSQIVLSQTGQGQSEDGLLEAWEITNLNFKADMVVLSACETARGRVGAGEGVIGLTWALFLAGCPTTVVSQWKVESASTAALMVEFYRRLRSRSVTKAEALRQAALKLLQNDRYSHPFYWAGFVVMGNGFR